MSRMIDRLVGRQAGQERAEPVQVVTETMGRVPELQPMNEFKDYVNSGYYASGVVFAVIGYRARILSEIEFKFQSLQDRNLFGSPALDPLEDPWPGGTTGDLVWRMEQDASLAGNAYILRTPNGLQRLDPGKIEIVSDGMWKAGYFYWPKGINNGQAKFLPVDEVAHYMPIPDPLRPFMGMSWLTPVASEILGDQEMEAHRRKFFTNAATPNLVIKVEQRLDREGRRLLEDAVAARYGSLENAYSTMVIDQGADVKAVGADFQQMQFVDVQGMGEIRVCQAGGVPPQLIGTMLGLKSSTFTNYQHAARSVLDTTIRPLWRAMAQSLEPLVDVPAGARLWYDDRHVPALQQDSLDQANIYDTDARTIGALIRAGWTAESARDSVVTGDFSILEHTGLIPNTLTPEEDVDSSGEDAEPGDPIEDM